MGSLSNNCGLILPNLSIPFHLLGILAPKQAFRLFPSDASGQQFALNFWAKITMTATSETSTVPNAKRLLWAGFMAILAAGVGFSIRAGILGQWAEQYGFTQTELGAITGGGLTGFGIIILLSSLLADKVGFSPFDTFDRRSLCGWRQKSGFSVPVLGHVSVRRW